MGFLWTVEQEKIIDASGDSRIIVGAGPGTGKTAVACGRVARLVDHYGLEPSNIMLISFTRAAVAEIRERIESFLENNDDAFSVRIATLDSFAWTLHSGFRENIPALDYSENIHQVIKLVKDDEGVKDYLKTIEHLIVDEAQDIVGPRADLIIKIIEQLSPDCGVTVFCDEAQAIYGFANDEDTNSDSRETMLVEQLCGSGKDFDLMVINEIQRVHSGNLKHIFGNTRKKVLGVSQETTPENWNDLLRELRDNADGIIEDDKLHEREFTENTFVLFRRRVEALLFSSFLGARPHRIRMSGLPTCIAPWVGACFSEYTDSKLSRTVFTELWEQRASGALKGSMNVETAWKMIVRIAGETEKRVDMQLFRKRLGRKQPPAEFCLPEIGVGGPVIATIHAAKGRESEHVYLMPPQSCGNGNGNIGEEIRVLYVGATRARESLFMGRGYRQQVGYLEKSRRIFCLHDKDHAQVEIGRDGDINEVCLASRNLLQENEAIKIQENLKKFGGSFVDALAVSIPPDYMYKIQVAGETTGCLDKTIVNRDLFDIGRFLMNRYHGRNKKPPQKINHLRIVGIRTIVVPPDSVILGDLHQPWATSGILLAPVVLSYPNCYFPSARTRY